MNDVLSSCIRYFMAQPKLFCVRFVRITDTMWLKASQTSYAKLKKGSMFNIRCNIFKRDYPDKPLRWKTS